MCYQGESSFYNNWQYSLQKNFTNEANRSGVFQLDTLNSQYELEMTIDKVQAVGPYVSQGFYVFAAFFYFYSFGDYSGPAETELAISYQLKKDGVVVHHNSFESKKVTETFKKGYKNKKDLIQTFATSMANSTSENFKVVIELMVNDLNDYLSSEK
jgi:hypothetical protein